MSKVLFYLLLLPYLFLFGCYMACYEVKLFFVWRGIKRRTYLNGVWTEE
jgi:hypothetical protein